MKEQIKIRTKTIGLEIIQLVESMPVKLSSRIIAGQIVRCSTSVGANYRAACRAKSTADMINKLKIVEEETDETIYWLEIMEESGLVQSNQLFSLKRELGEILAIVVSSIKTLRIQKN